MVLYIKRTVNTVGRQIELKLNYYTINNSIYKQDMYIIDRNSLSKI